MFPIINKDDPIVAVRTRLKELRERKGFSRMDIVRQAEISYPTVARWENDELDELDTDVLMKLCNLLDCTFDEFIVEITEDAE